MIASDSQRHPVEQLAEEFLDRFRRGERPSLSEFIERHPELAEQIRNLFPALMALEQAAPPARASEAAKSSAPLQVGHYRILREVGRGGMGVVYEAEHESLGRRVALKVLPCSTNLDPERLERFRHETRSAARLHHMNIVPVFEVGEHHGTHYYTMQFIRGQALDKVLAEVLRLRGGPVCKDLPPSAAATAAPTSLLAKSLVTDRFPSPLEPAAETPVADGLAPPPDAEAQAGGETFQTEGGIFADSPGHYFRAVARIGLQVAEALEYAHAQGVLHRDIKPSNLLLDEHGTVWVTDFGLAKDERGDLTRTGDVVGTLRFLPPERFHGISDARGDIYGLGLTLYELLTLQAAFDDADALRLVQRLTAEEPAPPRQIDRRIPRDLETIVLQAIAKRPADRYQTAGALAEDLRRFLADWPIAARRACWPEQVWRWRRRNPTVATLVSALLVTLILGFAGVTWQWRDAVQANAVAELERANAQRARRLAEARAEEMRQSQERLKIAFASVEEARRFAANKNWDDAIVEYTKATETFPELAATWEERGVLLLRLTLTEFAASDIQRAFDLQQPIFSSHWLRHALLRLHVGDSAGYRRVCQQMQARFKGPDVTVSTIDLVRTCALSPASPGISADQVALLEAELEHDARNASVLHVLGVAHYRAGEYERAVLRCREAIDADPSAAAAGINYPILAMAHDGLGRTEEAREALDRAALAHKTWIGQLANSRGGEWVVHQGATADWPIDPLDWLEFQLHFREAQTVLGTPPQDEPWLRILRARALAGLRRASDASAEYAAALELAPDDPVIRLESHRARGFYFVTLGDYPSAAAEYAQAAALSPDDVDLWRFQAIAHLGAGDLGAYRDVCTTMFDRFSSTTVSRSALVLVEVCVCRDDALPDWDALLPVAKLASAAYYDSLRYLGAAHYRAGQFAQALKYLGQSEDRTSLRAFDLYFLAMTHYRLGQEEAARRRLAEATAWLQEADRSLASASSSAAGRVAWGSWTERPSTIALRQEAEALIHQAR